MFKPPLVAGRAVSGLLLGVFLLRVEVAGGSRIGLGAEGEGGGDGSLVVSSQALAANLLELGVVGAEDMLLAALAKADGELNKGLSVVDELICRLLDRGELLIELRQRIVAQVVGLLDVWGDILVWALEVAEEGSAKGLVHLLGHLEESLAVGVGLDSRNARLDDGVSKQVLSNKLALVIGQHRGRMAEHHESLPR